MSDKGRVHRPIAVKNKSANPVQITAEQLLIEAQQQQEIDPKPPKQIIRDKEEMEMYQLRKRKDFEDHIRRSRTTLTHYIKYAHWEEQQGEFRRARSIFERALEVDYRNSSLWLKYAEMEMRNRHINHARNVWDRAVSLLPRVDQLWFKYAYMEEMLGNVPGSRQVFERWMEWEPDDHGWSSYMRLEMRYNEVERARAVMERYVIVHNTTTAWLKFAKFEDRLDSVTRTRSVYERALEALDGTEFATDEKLYMAFAKFEEGCKEHERARVIYKYALDIIPKQQASQLYKTYTMFEKQHGSREGIESVILSKRRFQYEEEVKKNGLNYDVWFDYVKLEEASGEVDAIREVYERAIANVPPSVSKNRWRRYIYLWINYALFEELTTKDMERTRAIYTECLNVIPHKHFSFSKIWVMAAHFEVRQLNLEAVRKVFKRAILCHPKPKVFAAYIDVEFQLNNIDRCRNLYESWLTRDPANCEAWMQFAGLEHTLEETERARGLYELAISQELLDMPEVMWKAFIDFEMGNEEYDKVRALYARLLERTKHVKVWISAAQFEASISEIAKAREVFDTADKSLKSEGDSKEDRVLLLENWRQFEGEFGTEETQKDVQQKQPSRIKRRRKIEDEFGEETGWEEYFDYVFPDEESVVQNNKLLAVARRWQEKKAAMEAQQALQSVMDESTDQSQTAAQEHPTTDQPATEQPTAEQESETAEKVVENGGEKEGGDKDESTAMQAEPATTND